MNRFIGAVERTAARDEIHSRELFRAPKGELKSGRR